MGGNDNEDNLISLTAREHFLAHWLLWRIYRSKEMAFAFFGMCSWKNKKSQREIPSSRAYSEAKIAFCEFQAKAMSSRMTNRQITSEFRDKMRKIVVEKRFMVSKDSLEKRKKSLDTITIKRKNLFLASLKIHKKLSIVLKEQNISNSLFYNWKHDEIFWNECLSLIDTSDSKILCNCGMGFENRRGLWKHQFSCKKTTVENGF